ncbi:hypothetical protein CJ214_03995 [Peptoniphilus lacrimalis]|uniref:Uncharacterized protein n=2 Tax=Gardnerella pickettii TaxID=2914924 RepID=T2PIH6_9BIFI|nr:hypothetical protein HMPREF1577_01458 [Gardnerella pickettii JCP8017A]EPI59591.1 hypothetical protein HMPREF1578_01300 [Gardnerella pickettii JCP8017B]KXA16806.1 hypothetical protein HMPREF3204_00345 [Gardnerella pickettii]PMC45373.1 hypothetical protein CJ214_03995 [Peptoniphilus lacrimalis]PKZ39748.1 hypothetical protein CYJ69_05985 [Gardnerella pickettii]
MLNQTLDKNRAARVGEVYKKSHNVLFKFTDTISQISYNL